MATTDLGKVSLTPRGEYDPAAAYEALDVVSWQGGSYLVLRAVQGVEPVGGEDYMVLTAKGDRGEKGDTVQEVHVVGTIAARDALEKIPGLTVYVKDAAGQEKATPAKWAEFRAALADYWFNTRTPAAFETLGDISVLNDKLLLRKDGNGGRFESWAEFAENQERPAEKTLLDEFLEYMEAFAASDMGTASANLLKAEVDNYYVSNKMDIRIWTDKDNPPLPYEDANNITAFRNQVKNRVVNLVKALKNKNISPYYDAATGEINLTWYQLQYYSYNMNNITATATSIVSPEDAYAYYMSLPGHDWAPAWASARLLDSQLTLALRAVSTATNASDYIDSTAKTVTTDKITLQHALLNYGLKTVPTVAEIKREVKYPWMYVAGGDPTVSQGGALYLWDGAGWIKSGDMLAEVYDPQGKREDVFKYVDTKLEGKADLINGKVAPEQLPNIQTDQIVEQAEAPTSPDTILWVDTDEETPSVDLDAAREEAAIAKAAADAASSIATGAKEGVTKNQEDIAKIKASPLLAYLGYDETLDIITPSDLPFNGSVRVAAGVLTICGHFSVNSDYDGVAPMMAFDLDTSYFKIPSTYKSFSFISCADKAVCIAGGIVVNANGHVKIETSTYHKAMEQLYINITFPIPYTGGMIANG